MTMIRGGDFLKTSDGWIEIARNDDTELAVVRSSVSGVLRLVALVDEEDRDLGDFYHFTDQSIRPGPNHTDAEIAAKMLAA